MADDLDLDAITAKLSWLDWGWGRECVTLTAAERDALVDEVRRLRAIEDMARFVLAEHDNANTRHKAGGNALGHCHRNPPKWDDRDAVCTWCVSVATLRHALEADRG